MTAKKQWLESTKASSLLAVYYGIIDLLERLSLDAESPPQALEVDERLLDKEWLETRISEGLVTVRVRPPSSGVSERLDDRVELASGGPVSIEIVPDEEVWGVRLGSLYEALPSLVLRTDASLYKKLAFETTRSGIEYMGIYTVNGLLAVFEGEHYRVTLPFVKSVASVHTHPEGSCLLSLKDVESGLDLLVEGGLFIAAVTTSCAFVMYRHGLVLEDDFFRVKEALLKARGRGSLDSLRLDSIRFYSVAY
ncbi:MAG: hypothetical protein F7C38_03745 [Desulfurococcales archaeon]|nr:hypothetical protein [Desulfurococcales archaeon]